MRTKLFHKGKSTKWQPDRKLPEAKLLKGLEARVGIEPTHKGFAVLVAKSKLLTNMGISVGRSAWKPLFFAPFCRLLAAKWQPDSPGILKSDFTRSAIFANPLGLLSEGETLMRLKSRA
jgi:hypothetical protein